MDSLDDGARATVAAAEGPGDAVVVALTGEIDLSNVPNVEAEIEVALPERPDQITFDLSELSFMDSSGIAMLLRIARKAGTVTVRNPSSTVATIIEATGLSEILRVVE